MIHLSSKPNVCDNPGLFWDQLYCHTIDYGHEEKPLQNAIRDSVHFY